MTKTEALRALLDCRCVRLKDETVLRWFADDSAFYRWDVMLKNWILYEKRLSAWPEPTGVCEPPMVHISPEMAGLNFRMAAFEEKVKGLEERIKRLETQGFIEAGTKALYEKH